MKTLASSLALAAAFFATAHLQAEDGKIAGVPAEYPLTKCVVSDEALGESGKPVKMTHGGVDVYLCCRTCKKDFDKDPVKFTKMVQDATAAAAKK